MDYADPKVCILCRSAYYPGTSSCLNCGVSFKSPTVVKLWDTLVLADGLRRQAFAEAQQSTPVVSPPVFNSPVNAPPVFRQPAVNFPEADHAPQPKKASIKLDAGTLLLMLGALFILVSGTILGAITIGRFVLPIVTVAAAGIAYLADRKQLRASTETMIGITAALGSLSVLMLIPNKGVIALFLWSLLGAASTLGFILLTRGRRDYQVPKWILGAYTIAISVLAALVISSITEPKPAEFLAIFVGMVAAIALAVGYYLLKINVAWQISAGFAVFALCYASVYALILLGDNPTLRRVFTEFRGLPVLVVAGCCALMAWLIHSATPGLIHRATPGLTPLTTPGLTQSSHLRVLFISKQVALGIALLLLFILFFVPLAHDFGKAALFFSLAVALLSAVSTKLHWVPQSFRFAGIFVAFSTLGYYLYSIRPQLSRVVDNHDAQPQWNVLLEPTNQYWWLIVAAAVGLTGYVALLLRWVENSKFAKNSKEIVSFFGVAQLPVITAFLVPNHLWLALSVAVAGGLFTVVNGKYSVVTLVSLAAAPIFVVPFFIGEPKGPLAILWFVIAVALLGLVVGYRPPGALREISLAGATGFALGALWLAGAHYQWNFKLLSLVLVLATVGIILISYLLRVAKKYWGEGVEYGAAAGLILGLATALDEGLAWMSLLFLIIGAPLVIIGLFDKSRNYYRYFGAAFLGISWILRLAASEIEIPEAYTAPFAAVLLAGGIVAMVKNTKLSSTSALGVGLSLTFLPSLPLIQASPVSWRALAIGVIALVMLLLAVYYKVKTPFIVPAGVLAFLAIMELGPYVLMIHRWVLTGVVGVLLTFIGFTWEARVKNSKSAVGYLSRMR